MEVCFSRELEDKLLHLASAQGRESSALVVEAVERMVDYDAWFLAEIEKGLRQIEADQTLSHDEVGVRLQKHIAAKLSPA